MELEIIKVYSKAWCPLPGYTKYGWFDYRKVETFRYYLNDVEVDIWGKPLSQEEIDNTNSIIKKYKLGEMK